MKPSRAIAAFFLLGALASGSAWSATVDESIADLSASSQAKVNTAIRGFVRAQVKKDRSANDLGWDCQAASSLVDQGVEGAKERLNGIAEELLGDAARSKRSGKPIGWMAVAERTVACVPAAGKGADGSSGCEGPSTVYAFQSGLGMACLAQAGARLKRPELIAAAEDAMRYWNAYRMPLSSCPGCIFFATSDSAADAERYIRNMNLFIAFGAAETAIAAGDAALRSTAEAAIRSDVDERRKGNLGYLGRNDPIWSKRPGEADRVENHSASVALLLAAVGGRLNDPAIKAHALTVYQDWANCDNKRCQTAGCSYWAGDPKTCQSTATVAHCAFRFLDTQAAARCETYLDLAPAVGSYGIWAVLQGGGVNVSGAADRRAAPVNQKKGSQ